jgi:hypothetical protein
VSVAQNEPESGGYIARRSLFDAHLKEKPLREARGQKRRSHDFARLSAVLFAVDPVNLRDCVTKRGGNALQAGAIAAIAFHVHKRLAYRLQVDARLSRGTAHKLEHGTRYLQLERRD